MKKHIIILLAIISVLVSSCSKEEIQLNKDYFGVAQAIKNGEKWNPYIYATNNRREPKYIAIDMTLHNRQNIPRESLFFNRIMKKEGFNVIKNLRYDASYYGYISDGDVICSSYHLDASTEEIVGFVNVTKYDEKSGKIEGTFEVTLIKESSCYTDSPDTLHFTEGVFSTKIQD